MFKRSIAVLAMSCAVGAPLLALADPVIRSATGVDISTIQGAIDSFRTDLGGQINPNNLGSAGSGRREINWDSLSDADAASGRLPGDLYNQASAGLARGVVFSTPGVLFQVSADSANPSATGVRFANINPNYSTSFSAFSAERLFTPLGSNVTTTSFFVPGSSSPATVSGFGAVFTDVDSATSTSIEYFSANGTSLGIFAVPATSGDGSFSFLGVSFTGGTRVSRVKITSGSAALEAGISDTTQGGTSDLVAMDDFIYGEPILNTTPSAPVIIEPVNGATIIDSTPSILGVGQANSTINLFDELVSLGSTKSDSSGIFSLELPTPLAVGSHKLTAKAVDTSGSASQASSVVEVTSLGVLTPPELSRNGRKVTVTMAELADAFEYAVTAKSGRVTRLKRSATNEAVLNLPRGVWTISYRVSYGKAETTTASQRIKIIVPR